MTFRRGPVFRPFVARGRHTIAAILLTFVLLSAISVAVSIWATSLCPAWNAPEAVITIAMLTMPASASAMTTSWLEMCTSFCRSASSRPGVRAWVSPECR